MADVTYYIENGMLYKCRENDGYTYMRHGPESEITALCPIEEAESRYPEIEKIDAALFFIMHDVIVDESYTREQMYDLWGVFYPHLERLKMSFQNDTWPENPTALCRFCPVVTCKFNKA